ncbi:hypothetical protein BGZ73_001048 [Actinomortierella ambigua]|nr:hypothetical protein BGZ73_001048 [Actinomortierella ambigua]
MTATTPFTPGTTRLLRFWRERYVDYNIDALLAKAGSTINTIPSPQRRIQDRLLMESPTSRTWKKPRDYQGLYLRQTIPGQYEVHPHVREADRRFGEQEMTTQPAKPRPHGESTLMGKRHHPLQVSAREKWLFESNLETRVHELKDRMAEASRSRCKAIKTKKAQGGRIHSTATGQIPSSKSSSAQQTPGGSLQQDVEMDEDAEMELAVSTPLSSGSRGFECPRLDLLAQIDEMQKIPRLKNAAIFRNLGIPDSTGRELLEDEERLRKHAAGFKEDGLKNQRHIHARPVPIGEDMVYYWI